MRTFKTLTPASAATVGLVAVATATLTIGCAMTGRPAADRPVVMRDTADAVVYINGLSCPF